MKKMLRIVGLLVLILRFPVEIQAADFSYIIDNGEVTITGSAVYWGVLVIPDIIDGLPVTKIGASAFQDNYFSSVTIPDICRR